jgi:thymidylate synthase ThyX
VSQTGFRVSVVADSVNKGVRLTTFACRVPRVLWAEALTHRAVSRNAASSRAVPVSYFVEQVESDPYTPGDLPDGELCGNGAGMVATKVLDSLTKRGIAQRYSWAAKEAAASAKHLHELGAHKQDANRVLEPFQWIRVVMTATDWDNFFALRTDHRAYPPFRFLARCMWAAYSRSEPTERNYHLPFITPDDMAAVPADGVEPPEWWPGWWELPGCGPKVGHNLMAWSAARCARVSVKNFRTDGTDRKKDYETFLKLTTETPKHASPLEHQAAAFPWDSDYSPSNFRKPWTQFRKLLPDETVENFSPTTAEVAGWNVPDDVFGGTPGVDW